MRPPDEQHSAGASIADHGQEWAIDGDRRTVRIRHAPPVAAAPWVPSSSTSTTKRDDIELVDLKRLYHGSRRSPVRRGTSTYRPIDLEYVGAMSEAFLAVVAEVNTRPVPRWCQPVAENIPESS